MGQNYSQRQICPGGLFNQGWPHAPINLPADVTQYPLTLAALAAHK